MHSMSPVPQCLLLSYWTHLKDSASTPAGALIHSPSSHRPHSTLAASHRTQLSLSYLAGQHRGAASALSTLPVTGPTLHPSPIGTWLRAKRRQLLSHLLGQWGSHGSGFPDFHHRRRTLFEKVEVVLSWGG